MVSLSDYARAVPFNAIVAFGHGSSGPAHKDPTSSLQALRRSDQGAWRAIDSVGTTARLVLSLLMSFDHRLSAERFAYETRPADPADIAAACDRLEVAGLIVRGIDGSIAATPPVIDALSSFYTSMADLEAIKSDVLQKICRTLGLDAPTRKQERIDAIAAAFADAESRARIRGELSPAAIELLDRIAQVAGPTRIDPDAVGIPSYQARYAAPRSYGRGQPPGADPIVGTLAELAHRGIVGVSEWDTEMWIWREAWPLVDQPMHRSWPSVPRPATCAVVPSSPRIAPIVAAADQILARWQAEPPPVLKNGERRIGKTQIRSTAKALRLEDTTVDLVGRLAISIDLLLPNVVAASGRGRQRRVDQAWLADNDLLAAWNALTPAARWARLVKQWCDSDDDVGVQLYANRHLVLWELAQLPPEVGYDDLDAFCAWFEHHHGPIGHPDAARECVEDLRLLGVMEASGPLALAPLGRQLIEDPASVAALVEADATDAYVQADLTVIAPPNLRHDLAVRLATLAEVENESGAVVSRLSLDRITTAVQRGETAESIIAFLTELSSVPLADTVTRLVRDAAARVGRVHVVEAPTVIAVSDPADLALVLAVKAAKLTQVTDTVAMSQLSPSKVRAALDKRGLAPDVVGGATAAGPRATRSSTDEARDLADQARRYRDMARGTSHASFFQRQADALANRAAALTDYERRLAVTTALSVTPRLVDQLDAAPPKSSPKRSAKSSTKRGPSTSVT